jgi:hypothetical protein
VARSEPPLRGEQIADQSDPNLNMSSPPSLVIPGRFGVPTSSGQKINKACDPCHISKTRCIPDPLSPTNSCKRCSKNGSSCVFSPIGPRRRPVRSKNDRIVELERRVRDMQLKLERQVERQVERKAEKRASGSSNPAEAEADADRDAPGAGAESFTDASAPGSSSNNLNKHHPHKPAAGPPQASFLLTTPRGPAPSASAQEPESASTQAATESDSGSLGHGVGVGGGGRPRSDTRDTLAGDTPAGDSCPSTTTLDGAAGTGAGAGAATETPDPKAPPPPPHHGPDPDVVDRGLITLGEADKLVKRFRQYMHCKFFGVGIPDGHSNQSLRRNKPATWLSVLCAASIGSDFISLYPTLSGEMEKLLDEQVQEHLDPDLDVVRALGIFYIFHNDLTQQKRGNLFQRSKTVANIVVRYGQASRLHNLPEGVPITEADVTERHLELSRQVLLWHWISFSLALKIRQDMILKPFHLVSSSLRILETSANQCDMSMVQWTKLIQISVDATMALFSGHDRTQGLSDEDRDHIIQTFERKRRQWLINCPFDLVNGELSFLMCVCVREMICPC